jgi:hypothetical protein
VRFRLIFATKAAFRPHFRGFSRAKIFRQNPLATKYFSKKNGEPLKKDSEQRNASKGSAPGGISPYTLGALHKCYRTVILFRGNISTLFESLHGNSRQGQSEDDKRYAR